MAIFGYPMYSPCRMRMENEGVSWDSPGGHCYWGVTTKAY